MLVEVHAAGVNRGDALEMRGWPYLARVMGYGIRRPKHPVLGTDVAGTVIALSEGVSEFDVGDEIVGFATGAFAELATLPASTAVHRPETISAEAAAAMPTTAVTAPKRSGTPPVSSPDSTSPSSAHREASAPSPYRSRRRTEPK